MRSTIFGRARLTETMQFTFSGEGFIPSRASFQLGQDCDQLLDTGR